MDKQKIIVRPESSNLWWGIYGFCEEVGWEDLNLFYENNERIGGVCLNTKAYLRDALQYLREDPEEKEFIEAIESYLMDSQCHYWYYYDDKNDADFYEVTYNAPQNKQGIKPRFTDIWHPDEGIRLSTIKSAVSTFALDHLEIANCQVEIQNGESLEEALNSFDEHKKLFGGETPIKISFSDDLIKELAEHWQLSEELVLKKLTNSTK
jgi:hypothetical protein